MRDVIQATLLGSLLFLDRADLLREWQQSGGTAAAMAAAVLSGHGQAGGEALVLVNAGVLLVACPRHDWALLEATDRTWQGSNTALLQGLPA